VQIISVEKCSTSEYCTLFLVNVKNSSVTSFVPSMHRVYCLPAKSTAKAFGQRRLPLIRVSRDGLITDERYIAGVNVLQSVQYSTLQSDQMSTSYSCRRQVLTMCSDTTIVFYRKKWTFSVIN